MLPSTTKCSEVRGGRLWKCAPVGWTVPGAGGPEGLPRRAVRLCGCATRRADAWFELCDALLVTERLVSLPHLSLEPAHRRGHGSLYAALPTAGWRPSGCGSCWRRSCRPARHGAKLSLADPAPGQRPRPPGRRPTGSPGPWQRPTASFASPAGSSPTCGAVGAAAGAPAADTRAGPPPISCGAGGGGLACQCAEIPWPLPGSP